MRNCCCRWQVRVTAMAKFPILCAAKLFLVGTTASLKTPSIFPWKNERRHKRPETDSSTSDPRVSKSQELELVKEKKKAAQRGKSAHLRVRRAGFVGVDLLGARVAQRQDHRQPPIVVDDAAVPPAHRPQCPRGRPPRPRHRAVHVHQRRRRAPRRAPRRRRRRCRVLLGGSGDALALP
jgi:hypothetical protein